MLRCAPFACFILLLLAGCAHVPASTEQLIRVSGSLHIEVFPGPPNYESIADGDAAEEAWILAAPAERFQLVVLSDNSRVIFDRLHRNIGRDITVDGVVWEAYTGHHHTARLITVRQVAELLPKGALEPTTK